MELNIIKGAKPIAAAIEHVAKSGARLDRAIWIAGLSVLAHAEEHNCALLMDKLVQAMPNGGRKLALVEWLLAFGVARKLVNEGEEAKAIKAGRVFKLDKANRTLNLQGAQEKAWYEFRKEAAPSAAFDAQAAVKGVLARIKAAAEKGLPIEHKAEALAEVQALLAVLQG